MEKDAIKKMKKDIRSGLVAYMEEKNPGKSLSTYKTYASDSNYLLNNEQEDTFIRFVRSKEDDPKVKQLIVDMLIEHRGADKVTDGGEYYYEKLCWQREYIQSIGGIDSLLGLTDEHVENFIINAEYDEKVQEIAIKLLQHIVKTNETISYGDLSAQLSFEMNPRNIEKPLGVISFACKDNNLPPISVMVVNKDTLMPGNGYYDAYCPEIKGEDARWKKCFELMKEVQGYSGWDEVLTAFKNWH